MKDNDPFPNLGTPPKQYDPVFFERAFQRIQDFAARQNSVGPIRVSAINISDLPTSATGLRTGDLWNDSNTVKIVP